MTDRQPLQVFICKRQHAYEWAAKTGSHSGRPRTSPCTECGDMAALVVEWLAGEVASDGLEAAS